MWLIMPKNLKKNKKNLMKNISPNSTFSAPPYDYYGAFYPGGYYRIYHRVEAEKMRRSYDWLRYLSITEIDFEKIIKKMIQDIKLLIKVNIDELILNIENGEYDNNSLKEYPFISSLRDERMIEVELGDDQNKKNVSIDVEDLEIQ